MRRLFRDSIRSTNRRRHTRRLGVESLEHRALLAAVTFEFASSVSQTQIGAAFQTGDSISGMVTLDTSAPDAYPTSIPDGDKTGVFQNAIMELRLDIGGKTMTADPFFSVVAVANDIDGEGDAFVLQFQSSGDIVSPLVEVSFTDPSATAIGSDQLTLLPDYMSFRELHVKTDPSSDSPNFLAGYVDLRLAKPAPDVKQGLEDLIKTIKMNEDLSDKVKNKLVRKLDKAIASWQSDNVEKRENFDEKMEDFIEFVEDKPEKKIPGEVGKSLLDQAKKILESID